MMACDWSVPINNPYTPHNLYEIGALSPSELQKPSKAMKRREKMEKDEVRQPAVACVQPLPQSASLSRGYHWLCCISQVERQARVAEEAAALGPSSRLVEEEALEKLLGPAGLCMKDIKVWTMKCGHGVRCAPPAPIWL